MAEHTTVPYTQEYRDGFAHGRDVGLASARIQNADLLAALEETRRTLSFVTSNPITAFELHMAKTALTQADAAIARAKEVK